MSDQKPSLHVDTDWKRQAQEEKKRLAEEEAKKVKESPAASSAGPAAPPFTGAAPQTGAGTRPGAARGRGEMPPPSFSTLVQSLLTQILFYLGDLHQRGGEPSVNLDMAKHQIDILGVLEEKTRNNLTEEEKQILDTALYEVRMRYVNVASQFT